jgi:ABC-type glutathione transport system ATPase component
VLLHQLSVSFQTHNVALAAPIADFVVSLGLDGRIQTQGTIEDALKLNAKLLEETKKAEQVEEKAKDVIDEGGKQDDKKTAGKLIVAEEISEGHVRWPALSLYIFSLGGYWFWTLILTGDLATTILGAVQTWYLGHWAHQYELHPNHPEHVSVPK